MKKISIFLSLMLLTMATAFAQNVTVSGSIKDAVTDEAIPGASVLLKGTRTGAVADLDGNYSIKVPSGSTLVFSSIGYQTEEVVVNGSGNRVISIALQPDSEMLSDVLVVAYGTAKKESFTGSAQTIKSEQIEKRTVANVTKALDGMAAGVQTTSGSGQPGAGASVIIRGYGSINASTSPLYVVDGVPYDGSINALNPNDIESMTVIKDASAGALYGARGANGVVIITTKHGGEGRAKIAFKALVGVSSRAIPRYDTLNAKEWTEDVYYMYKNDLLAEGYAPLVAGQMAAAKMASGADAIFGTNEKYNPFSKPVAELFDHTTGKIVDGVTTKWEDDWLDLSTDPSPVRQEYQMTVTGGNKANQYMFSVGYLKEEGLVKMTNFERMSGRANVQSQINEWFKTGLNVNFAHKSIRCTPATPTAATSWTPMVKRPTTGVRTVLPALLPVGTRWPTSSTTSTAALPTMSAAVLPSSSAVLPKAPLPASSSASTWASTCGTTRTRPTTTRSSATPPAWPVSPKSWTDARSATPSTSCSPMTAPSAATISTSWPVTRTMTISIST